MKISRSKLHKMCGRIISGVAVLMISSLPVLGQSSPPTMIQVPFVSVGAGNIVSGVSSTSKSSSCTAGLATMGGSTTGIATGTNYGDGCPAGEAGVDTPWGAAADAWGNIYFADEGHIYVRVIYGGATTVNGVANPATAMIEGAYASGTGAWSAVTPVAGNVYAVGGGYTAAIANKNSDGSYACNNVTNGNGPDALTTDGSGCPANYSYIKGPYNPAVDSEGNLFIVDKSNSVVYVVLANATGLAAQLVTLENPTVTSPQVGYIYQIAGKGGAYADGVLANNAGEVHAPYAIAVDSSENLYIADYTNNAIRMINGPATTTTGASSADCSGGSCGPGYIHTIAGNSCTSSGCVALATAPASGQAAFGAAFLDPAAVAVDGSGNVYIGDNGAGTSTVPATVRVIYAGGASNALASLICLEQASNISSCTAASLTAGDVYTIAGSGNAGGSAKGAGLLATNSGVSLDRVQGLGIDSRGNVYVMDYGSHSELAEINASTGALSFLSADGEASSATTYTVGNYCATQKSTGSGPVALDEYGDGCPGPQGYFKNAEGNIGIDPSGNLYFADNGDSLVRKLTFSGTLTANITGTAANITAGANFPATAVATSTSAHYLAFELLTGSTGDTVGSVAVSALTQGNSTGSEFTDPGTAAGDTCTGSTTLAGFSSTSTNTASDVCVVPVNFAPAHAGARSGAVEVTAEINGATSSQVLGTAYVSGIGNAAALVIDPSAATSIGTGTAPQGVAVDSAGNTYIAWANGTVSSTPGGTLSTAITGETVNPHQVAVDGAGDVYVADTGSNRIAEFVVGATSPITAVSGLSSPQGVALDASGNLYIADTGNQRVLLQAAGNGLTRSLGSGFVTPVAVAVDAAGNVYVADKGLGAIVEIAAGSGTQSTVLSGIAPVGLGVDAAGDIEYVDSALNQVVEIPVSGASAAIVTGLTTPLGVALDPNGGLYVADAANSGVSYFSRTSSTQAFASTSGSLSASLTNIGNQTYTEAGGVFAESNSTDFSITGSSTNGCSLSSLSFASLAPGTNCGVTALFTPVNTGNLSDTVTFSGNAVNGSSVTFNVSGTNTLVLTATTTSVGSLSPSSPAYGQTVSVTVAVSQNSGNKTPTGSVVVTVDGVAQPSVNLTAGSYLLTLTSLSAGQHTISAAYTPTGNFSASVSSSPLTFTVAPVAITASANPVTSTYGQPIPAITGSLSGVLTPDLANVSAVFTTTATSTSPVGSYPISVQLSGSASGNYTVTLTGTPMAIIQQATVTLAVGSASKVYGASNPAFSGVFSGVLTQDLANVTANYSTTATASSVVGSYPITATALGGAAAGNYTLGSVTPGTLTITQLGIIATTASVKATYGQPVPVITGTLTGVLTQDTANVNAVFSTTATPTSPVGSYPIGVTLSGSAAGNYQVSLSGSPVVTVQAAPVAVTVNSATRAYGAANPVLSGVLTGVLAQDAANVAAVYSTTATVSSPVASYPITATSLTGSAVGNYTLGTVTPGTLTVTQAGTTTGLTVSTPTIAEGSQVTFTATVTSATSGTPAGSVIFSSGTTTLSSVSLINGVATFSTNTLIFGTQSVTATYNGNTNFSASTSSPVSVNVTLPIVTGTASVQSVTLSGSSSGTVTINLTAMAGYTGTATYSCALLPADMTCSFNPATSTFTAANTTASTVLTISTKAGSTTTARSAPPTVPGQRSPASLIAVAGFCLPGMIVGLWGLGKWRKSWLRSLMMLVVLVAGMAGVSALGGCGGSSGSSQTPAGTYNIQVEITAGTVQTVPLTVVVQ